jgi:hypothetical protein
MKNILGGTINAENLINENKRLIKYDGMVAWTCMKPSSNEDEDDIFLAFEIQEDFPRELTNEEQHFPKRNPLDRPFSIYKYDPSTDSDIEKLLVEHNLGRENIRYRSTIEKGGAWQLSENFKQNGPKKGGVELNCVSLGFFDNETSEDVNTFLASKPKWIRYYFGYDDSYGINKIRIILIGVDETGKNMIPKNEKEAFIDGPLILQKSWPPDSNS